MNAKVKSVAWMVALALTISGCASSNLIFPSTSGIDKVKGGTLSSAQQKAVIEDLQNDTVSPAATN